MLLVRTIPLALLLAAPAFAQTNAPAQTEAAPVQTTGVTAANLQAQQAIADRQAADQAQVDASQADRGAAYAEDMASYERALRRHDRAARLNDHQQHAYADAMVAWRIQVADCKRGISKACRAPTPNPADYW